MKKDKEIIKKNKELCKEYPFLKPRNRWTGKLVEDYDYSYTELDDMPLGWRIAFGEKLLKELKVALGDHLNKYRIVQIKEKYGYLRWYDFGHTEEAYEVISKYSKLSETTCIVCGKPATKITRGWISPYCDEHFPKNETNWYDIKESNIVYDDEEDGE